MILSRKLGSTAWPASVVTALLLACQPIAHAKRVPGRPAKPLLDKQVSAKPVSGAVERIVEVRYIGLGLMSPRDIEGKLPFSPGDPWSEKMTAESERSVLAYLESRGFYGGRVRVQKASGRDPGTAIVSVRIEEGPPCTIGRLWIDDPPGFKSVHVMQRFKSRMHDVLKMTEGDRYDEEVLRDRVRELRDWLVYEDFILANTDKVRLNFNESRTKVEVVLAVDYGERVTFGFQGNTVFSKSELNEMIRQVRATGLGKDYVGVIQRKFLEEYRSRAFNEAEIEVRYSERPLSKQVSFFFKEGIRTEVSEVVFDGLSPENLAKAKEVFASSSSRLLQRDYFVEKDLDKANLYVVEDLRSRGFLSSRVVGKNIQVTRGKDRIPRARVVVQFAEGEQTFVGQIDLKGFHFVSEQRVLEFLGATSGKPFNPFALEEGLEHLRKQYRDEAFLDYRVVTKDHEIAVFGEKNRIVNLQIEVDEGPRVRIGGIDVKGLQLTKEYIVRRELLFHGDELWLSSTVGETESNLRKLGLFSEVRVIAKPSEKGPDFRDMVIDLKEADPGLFEAGPGFRSDLGVRAFSRVSYTNIFGRGWIGSLGAEGNRRVNRDYRFFEYKFDATFVEPRFFSSDVSYTIGVSTKKQRFPPDFNAVTTQVFTGFERRFTNEISAKILYRVERIRQFDVYFQNQYSDRDNRSMLIGSLVPSITFDTRDNPFTTTSGWLATGSLEYAHPYLSNQPINDVTAPGYQKWTASLRKYTSITKDIVWSKMIAGGFARSQIGGREIPLIKLFRLGGYSTIRGFAEDSINVDVYRIEGTLTFLNFRTQFDLPFVGDLKLSPFLDAGNLYIDQFQAKPFLRVGSGVGLHYMTPVGPINLDWGHKLNPIGGESPNQIHFSVGMI